ncbi:DUF302 domain-containing protein [uncultured Shewanella sp.]|uniref:DUF302 domain-containing protein n=1 Tax=uncultured Shewanella sp. TaxID=173975 RepID=UPI00260D3E90|nr:DUF302 domain-containing protein [uncultured Shewanella sp.]
MFIKFKGMIRRLILPVEVTRISIYLLVCGQVACSKPPPIPESDYQQTDALMHTVSSNISQDPLLDKVLNIDHSRLARSQGSRLAPTQVALFHNKLLESQLLQINPLIAMEFPIKLLAYQEATHGEVKLVWNDFSYLSQRYGLGEQPQLAHWYEQSIAMATQGIDESILSPLSLTRIDEAALITVSSSMDFESSLKRAVNIARDSKGVIVFDIIDFQAVAKEHGIMLPQMTLVLFGAPGPGGRAMKASQSLGLDGFPQKVLIWNDNQGNTHITYNELLLIATRHKVPINTALRIIQRRIDKAYKRSFSD